MPQGGPWALARSHLGHRERDRYLTGSDGIAVGGPADTWTLRLWPRKGAHMRTSRFTETQIVAVLKRRNAGAKAADVCREFGISETTLYNLRAK
jgi:hypothetical protein